MAKSTCEAEYMACSETVSQLLWTKQMLAELAVDRSTPWCDNNPAVELTKNDRITFKSRHVAPHCHFVRQHHGLSFNIEHISSIFNTADICTKALARPLFCSHVDGLIADAKRTNWLKEGERRESSISCYYTLHTAHVAGRLRHKYLDKMDISDLKERAVSGIASIFCGSHTLFKSIK